MKGCNERPLNQASVAKEDEQDVVHKQKRAGPEGQPA